MVFYLLTPTGRLVERSPDANYDELILRWNGKIFNREQEFKSLDTEPVYDKNPDPIKPGSTKFPAGWEKLKKAFDDFYGEQLRLLEQKLKKNTTPNKNNQIP